ncbi:MAG: rhodanese-like domain-containing protein [Ignavibacteriaceae bacterium]
MFYKRYKSILSYKKISAILITSTFLGILVNYFNPDGIPLIREKLELSWVSDSLFHKITQDSDSTNVDKTNTILEKPAFINESTEYSKKESEKEPDEKIVQPKDLVTTNNPKETEVVAFTEPKAIKLEQAYILFSKGVTFVDARDESEYLAGHIASSINIPFDDFDNHKQKLDLLSKEKPLILYCAGTDCDLSILLGNLLFEMGYKQVYVFFGGWQDWVNANYPVEHPSK